MIILSDIRFTLMHGGAPLTILDRVDLTLARGRRLGVIGPSGSGKSTLLALIAGVERPTAGSVRVGGVDYATLDDDHLARFRRSQIGIVFQEFHLIAALTALENVALPLELAGRPDALDQAEVMLRTVGLAHRLTHRPRELSGGEQQRVAIARAFIARPPLVLADEPTGNLDQHTSAEIANLLFNLTAEWGSTLLLVTHEPTLAARCDELRRMVAGCLLPGEEAA